MLPLLGGVVAVEDGGEPRQFRGLVGLEASRLGARGQLVVPGRLVVAQRPL